MKKIFVLTAFALTIGVVLPTPASALSCIDPEGMIDYIVSNPDSIVVTATPTEQVERVKDKAVKDDVNQMYDSGYTGQFIDIEKAHMGTVPDRQWVYFHRDATWNYLCAGEPPKVGTKNIYVIQVPQSNFELQTVTAVYPVGSDLADDLLAAIEDADSQVEPAVYEVTKADWVTRLHDELKEMAFLVKVKLAEWQFWKAKVS